MVECVVNSKSQLGEGPVWHNRKNLLYWVDIDGKKIHIFDPETKINKTINVSGRPGTVVATKSDDLLIAMEHGFFKLNIQNGNEELIGSVEENNSDTRFNDGKCDPVGRFWAGTLSESRKTGGATLYCMEEDYSISTKIENVTISNGITWSLDEKNMYYIDTPTHKVISYDYDKLSGNISNPKIIIESPKEYGRPDGMSIDSKGNLWIGMYRGECVTHWNPSIGKLLNKIEVPAQNITACAFGGKGLKTLFLTTAIAGTSEENMKKYPQSGGLFTFDPGVSGVPSYEFSN